MKKALQRSFPWICQSCKSQSVFPSHTNYRARLKHKGTIYKFEVPDLNIPICQSCQEKVFTREVDEQINKTFEEIFNDNNRHIYH